MPALFGKPLDQVTARDVDELVGWPESLLVEYKEDLPARDGRKDAWIAGGNVEQYAKDRLFKEVVALANTAGGHVIVGMAETTDIPAAAASVVPVPRCVDLGERLGRASQVIDPPVPLLQVRGIPTQDDGSGIVIFRVPPSWAAPHRGPDRECYVRRDTNSVAVSMRDIQDMTLARGRRDEQIRERFSRSASQFMKWFETPLPGFESWTGFRITAVPIGAEFNLGRLYGTPLATQQIAYCVEIDSVEQRAEAPYLPQNERPKLRGTRRTDDTGITYLEIGSDGSLDFGFRSPSSRQTLAIGFLLAYVINLIRVADGLRNVGGAPDAEYAVEAELHGYPTSEPLTIVSHSSHVVGFINDIGQLDELPFLLPRLSFGPMSELDQVITQIYNDVRDGVGFRFPKPAALKVSEVPQWWLPG
jgi:hypothetical protein